MIFWKVQASGNDFILIDCRNDKWPRSKYSRFAKQYCSRKVNVGADGILVVEGSKKANLRMRIFNADGSEAEMCGNGSRCFALWVTKYIMKKNKCSVKFDTAAGMIEANVDATDENAADVRVRLSDPAALSRDFSMVLSGRKTNVSFVNTGVPHAVIFTENLDTVNVQKRGYEVRHHKKFYPAGTNVNFVQMLRQDTIKIRTYERGVEDETLSCGTGTCASAIIAALSIDDSKHQYKMKVLTRIGEELTVEFRKEPDGKICDVWFCGKTFIVYEGNLLQG